MHVPLDDIGLQCNQPVHTGSGGQHERTPVCGEGLRPSKTGSMPGQSIGESQGDGGTDRAGASCPATGRSQTALERMKTGREQEHARVRELKGMLEERRQKEKANLMASEREKEAAVEAVWHERDALEARQRELEALLQRSAEGAALDTNSRGGASLFPSDSRGAAAALFPAFASSQAVGTALPDSVPLLHEEETEGARPVGASRLSMVRKWKWLQRRRWLARQRFVLVRLGCPCVIKCAMLACESSPSAHHRMHLTD
jgi:hypothetical protein